MKVLDGMLLMRWLDVDAGKFGLNALHAGLQDG